MNDSTPNTPAQGMTVREVIVEGSRQWNMAKDMNKLRYAQHQRKAELFGDSTGKEVM